MAYEVTLALVGDKSVLDNEFPGADEFAKPYAARPKVTL
jgi:hypothetical protein